MIPTASVLRGRVLAAILPAAFVLAACGKPQELGSADTIIAGVPDAEWAEIEDAVYAALEPRAFTVRNERIFEVTQADPTSTRWGDFRRFRQILLIGEASDPWIAEALDEVDGTLPTPPAIVRAEDVWARNQQITIALTPPGAELSAALPLLDEIGNQYLTRFQAYAAQRMFASGADSALADSLRSAAGFSLLLPNVYYGGEVAPDTYVFRNDYPDPSQLIRSVLVTSRPADETALTAEAALAWRDQVASSHYQPPHSRDTATVQVQDLAGVNGGGVEVQGVWSNPPGEWPAAGPFITRLISCPEQQRAYLLDAWLYAPGSAKYEYMLQLDTILNSFTCGTATE